MGGGPQTTATRGRQLQNEQNRLLQFGDRGSQENFERNLGSGDFVAPCVPVPEYPLLAGWSQFPENGQGSDDGSLEVQLNFPFTFYGTTYPQNTIVYINNNGNISFGSAQSSFTAVQFPTDEFRMIAAFWADVDTRGEGQTGRIYWKQTPTTLIVTWDQVGYYFQQSDKVNTFQLVIAADPSDLAGTGNACFCYADMDWTTGDASGGAWTGFGGIPATVGVNGGNGVDFVQFGRFNQTGMAYDGGYGANDGVDYLDARTGSPHAFCLDIRSVNVPPVLLGFPVTPIQIPCQTEFKILLTFMTPEPTQTVYVTPPTVLPPGMTLVESGNSMVREIVLTWTPQPGQSGDYELLFSALDSHNGFTKRNLLLTVADCADDDKCVPIAPDDACDPFEPRPFCTPFRSVEYCPDDKSFPNLISSRYQIIRDDPLLILDEYFWFPYLEDKVAAYAFSASSGVNTPHMHCCVDSPYDLADTCFPPGHTLTSLVIRASGHHSGNGVFVLPYGLGGIELLRGTVYQLSDVVSDLAALYPAPTKILVEEFIFGDAGPQSLPTEYKFHVFNGKIGAVSAVYNRGTACPCYAEFDTDFNRLDKYGCFEPGSPQRSNGACYDIDFEAGAQNVGPVKGFDICDDPLPDIPECLWEDMVKMAEDLSRLIGVYTRIDMFVSNNIAYVQEFSANHNGGLRHCWSQRHDTGCIDSCFMGRMWWDNSQCPDTCNPTYGGPKTPVPTILEGWHHKGVDDMCAAAKAVYQPPLIKSCYP